jgi:hypothetical protein
VHDKKKALEKPANGLGLAKGLLSGSAHVKAAFPHNPSHCGIARIQTNRLLSKKTCA